MNPFSRPLALAVLATAALAPDLATAQNLSGQWTCEYGYAEYDRMGNHVRGTSMQYVLMLYDNGQYQAQGTILSGAGVSAFQAQGQWMYNPSTGQLVSEGINVNEFGLQAPHPLTGQLSSDGRTIELNEQGPDSTGSYIAQRMAQICQKAG
jgi:hypothetical protein